MNLKQRLHKLEQHLQRRRCRCTNSAELSWPTHQPDPHCPNCAGERLVHPLTHHPGTAEPLIRAVLPLIEKADTGHNQIDLSKLTNTEVHQLKTAFQALEHTTPTPHPKRKPERPPDTARNSCVACERSTHTGPPPIRPRFQEPLLYPLSYGGATAILPGS